jgi:hypothetical protein
MKILLRRKKDYERNSSAKPKIAKEPMLHHPIKERTPLIGHRKLLLPKKKAMA